MTIGTIGSSAARAAIDEAGGVLQLAPTWVPRSFATPGRRLRLAEEDLFFKGAERGGIDERWFASTTPADNGPGTPDTEGLSFVVTSGRLGPTLADLVAAYPEEAIGAEMAARYGRWPVYAKFFDNDGPLPLHLHHRAEHAALVGREPKPEAYYFPPQMNGTVGSFPISFFGLEAGTTPADVKRCLERWGDGDNRILRLARGFKLEPGTGWLVPPGVLHAPGSFCTFEVQWGSDVFSMWQSMVDGRPMPKEVLLKDIPGDRQEDLDFIVSLADWPANLDPEFKLHHLLVPHPIGDTAPAGWQDRWVIFGRFDGEDLFSARELTVQPGKRMLLQDQGASGLVITQGRGRIGGLMAEVSTYIRQGDLTADEFFITAAAAAGGVVIENTGHEPLVVIRYFGPGSSPDMPEPGDPI